MDQDFSIARVVEVKQRHDPSMGLSGIYARLEVDHSQYDTADRRGPVELHNIRTRSEWWPVSKGIFTFDGQLPSDVKVGDEVEVMFSYAGYWSTIRARIRKQLRYVEWKAQRESENA